MCQSSNILSSLILLDEQLDQTLFKCLKWYKCVAIKQKQQRSFKANWPIFWQEKQDYPTDPMELPQIVTGYVI